MKEEVSCLLIAVNRPITNNKNGSQMVAVFCFSLIVKEKRLPKYCFLNLHLRSGIIFVQIFRKTIY